MQSNMGKIPLQSDNCGTAINNLLSLLPAQDAKATSLGQQALYQMPSSDQFIGRPDERAASKRRVTSHHVQQELAVYLKAYRSWLENTGSPRCHRQLIHQCQLIFHSIPTAQKLLCGRYYLVHQLLKENERRGRKKGTTAQLAEQLIQQPVGTITLHPPLEATEEAFIEDTLNHAAECTQHSSEAVAVAANHCRSAFEMLHHTIARSITSYFDAEQASAPDWHSIWTQLQTSEELISRFQRFDSAWAFFTNLWLKERLKG
jgi:hypothetical protein